ncbi:hypothetical protein BDV93DRAFT_405737, partial [Ceratobasidium sp. AG-I]
DVIPEWSGDTEDLADWLIKCEEITGRSWYTDQQAGELVPYRLTSSAGRWFQSLSQDVKEAITQNWDTLQNAIISHFMTRAWYDKQKSKALRMCYRDEGNSSETPSDYIIRKKEHLTLIQTYSPTELIYEIMAGAPPNWQTILRLAEVDTWEDFQNQVCYYEDTLIQQ